MFKFQERLSVIVTPSSLAFWTTSSSWPLMNKGGRSALFLENDIRIPLHLSMFNWNLLSPDQSATESTYSWALLDWPLGMILETVVSSTYFHNSASRLDKSLMMMTKSHGPSLVPWGTPEGTKPHSDTHPSASFVLCWRLVRKSIIQLMMEWGKFKVLKNQKT